MKYRIRVPATTANLGPGFDCLGLALDWWNTIQVERAERGLSVDCYCDTADLPCDGTNLVIRSMRTVYRRARQPFPSLHVEIKCDVPVGRGLGSSASAIVGGVVAANALLKNRFSRQDLLEMASDLEGHPDNVAPALLGGFVVAVREGKGLQTARIPVPRNLRCVLFVPERALATKISRHILPKHIAREDAIYNIGRTALWMAALHKRDWNWLDLATGDRLHQPYRAKLVHGMDALFESARRAGARGVALSGSGPSIVAFADRHPERIARAMARAASQIGLVGKTQILKVSAHGAKVSRVAKAIRFD